MVGSVFWGVTYSLPRRENMASKMDINLCERKVTYFFRTLIVNTDSDHILDHMQAYMFLNALATNPSKMRLIEIVWIHGKSGFRPGPLFRLIQQLSDENGKLKKKRLRK